MLSPLNFALPSTRAPHRASLPLCVLRWPTQRPSSVCHSDDGHDNAEAQPPSCRSKPRASVGHGPSAFSAVRAVAAIISNMLHTPYPHPPPCHAQLPTPQSVTCLPSPPHSCANIPGQAQSATTRRFLCCRSDIQLSYGSWAVSCQSLSWPPSWAICFTPINPTYLRTTLPAYLPT